VGRELAAQFSVSASISKVGSKCLITAAMYDLKKAATWRTATAKAACNADALLVAAGSGATTLGTPSSPGVPAGATQDTLLLPYNDLDATDEVFERHGSRIATVLVEPVAGNMGLVPPAPGFLPGLRDLCTRHGALLIFDEVITGFRLTYGGAQSLYGVSPDLTCLGKIIGGGLPVGAYGGRGDVMELVAPLGPVYQAGTLSGNPLAMAAGIEALNALHTPGTYKQLDGMAASLAQGLERLAKGAGVELFVSRAGSMLTPFFGVEEVSDYKSAVSSDTRQYAIFFNHMLNQGIYLPPSQFEACFISLAHTDEDIERTLSAASHAFSAMGR